MEHLYVRQVPGTPIVFLAFERADRRIDVEIRCVFP